MLEGKINRVTVAARMEGVSLPRERSRRPSMSSWGMREGGGGLQHGAGVDLTLLLPHSHIRHYCSSFLPLLVDS